MDWGLSGWDAGVEESSWSLQPNLPTNPTHLISSLSKTRQEIDPTKVYVIGGLVDRVVLKGRSLGRAQSQGVATARLPLLEFFKRAPNGHRFMSNVCLAVDRVMEILMRLERSRSWDVALQEAFPLAMMEERASEADGNVNEQAK